VCVKPITYQPNREELNEEHDMPSMTAREVREVFFEQVKIVEKKG